MLPQFLELSDSVILFFLVALLIGMKLTADALAGRLTSMVVRRLSDGTHWTPAGDTPYPIDGFNFVPASKCRLFGFGPIVWAKQAAGQRWMVADPALFEIVVPSQLGPVGQQ